jgi:hypothetical protein
MTGLFLFRLAAPARVGNDHPAFGQLNVSKCGKLSSDLPASMVTPHTGQFLSGGRGCSDMARCCAGAAVAL